MQPGHMLPMHVHSDGNHDRVASLTLHYASVLLSHCAVHVHHTAPGHNMHSTRSSLQ